MCGRGDGGDKGHWNRQVAWWELVPSLFGNILAKEDKNAQENSGYLSDVGYGSCLDRLCRITLSTRDNRRRN